MINSSYLNEETIIKIKELFFSNKQFPSIKLQNFFDKDFYGKVSKSAFNSDYKKEIKPMQYYYLAAKAPRILNDFLNSNLLIDLISKIINEKIEKINGRLYSFGWKDYTLLHDKKIEKEGFDFIIDFTYDWNQRADGKLIYTDGKGNYNYIPSSSNTLTIAFRKKNMQKFMQYVNHYANKNKRYIFIGSIE